MKIYALYDKKADCYLHLHTSRNSADATRSFEAGTKAADSNLAMFPDDFALVELGEFDEFNGILQSLPKPNKLCWASDFVTKN